MLRLGRIHLISILFFAVTWNKKFSVRSDIVPIHKFIYNNNGLGAYSFEFVTGDGTYRREDGSSSPEDGSLVVRGEYGYVDTRGRLYTVRYIADTNGYQPISEGDTRFNDRRIV